MWNSNLYDTKHAFVSRYGEGVVELLHPQPGEQILDAGCGTGDLAQIISESGAVVTGIDSSDEMIATAKQKYPFLNFKVAHVEDYVKENFYEAIFSNATLHWVTDNKKAAECFYKSLKQEGRLVAEFGGKGNVNGIIEAIKSSLAKFGFEQNADLQNWYFPSVAEYSKVLEDAGFSVAEIFHFDRPTLLNSNETGIKDWVKMFGSNFFKGVDDETMEYVLEDIKNSLRQTHFRDNEWYADYIRLRVGAIKI